MKKAFSLIELSIVILIIGILVAGVVGSSRLVAAMRLASARQMTQSSPVPSISGLVLWLEPTLENSFAISSVPVTPSILTTVSEPDESAGIGRWNDSNPQSTIKNDATQTVALSVQPTYTTKGINNLPSLYFASREATATDNYLISNLNIDYTQLSDITVFVVYKISTTFPNTSYCLFGNDNSGTFDRFLCPRHASNAGNGTTSNGTAYVTVAALNTTNAAIASTVLRNGVASGSTIYINGTSAVNFTESHPNSGTSNLYIGMIGVTSPFGSFEGHIAEFIVFNRALKNDERKDVEKYLGKKWGIAVS